MKFRKALFLLPLCALLALGACTRLPQSGQLADSRLVETSGIAATRAGPTGVWALNDGGNGAVLYRLDDRGATQQRVVVTGTRNHDWEDMASFTWREQAWIVIADIGDNAARRRSVRLHLLREPGAETTVTRPLSSLEVIYPDGPRDAEGLAVDATTGFVYVLSKRDRPNRLYRLPLDAFDNPDTAHRFESAGSTPLDTPPGVQALIRQPVLLAIGGYSTAFDISADGTRAVVLGYRRARTATRRDGESWSDALQRLSPLPDHALTQAEAAAFTRNGKAVVVTSEGEGAPLITQPLN